MIEPKDRERRLSDYTKEWITGNLNIKETDG